MAALWLAMLAPTVSRVLACMPAHAVMADMSHDAATPHPMPPGEPMGGMDKCGYCGLLNHTPLTSGTVAPLVLVALRPAQRPATVAIEAPRGAPLLSAQPRGPPPLRLP